MAYAAVVFLKHTIQLLMKSAYEELESLEDVLERLDDDQLQSLKDVLKRLGDELHMSIDRSAIDELDAEIREAVWKLQYVLESYVLYHSVPPSDSLTDTGCPRIAPVERKGVKKEIKSFLKKVKKLEEE